MRSYQRPPLSSSADDVGDETDDAARPIVHRHLLKDIPGYTFDRLFDGSTTLLVVPNIDAGYYQRRDCIELLGYCVEQRDVGHRRLMTGRWLLAEIRGFDCSGQITRLVLKVLTRNTE